MTGLRILVVDDEGPIRRFLRIALEAEGYEVVEAPTAREGIRAAVHDQPAALILDLGLPDADGLSVLKAVREWSEMPVLVLSVRADEAGKVAALDGGAQDYVTKPFGTRELLARLRALLRDRGGQSAPSVIEVADLRINAGARMVTRKGEPIRLTRREFDLLWLLASQAGRLVTQAQILKTIWGPAHEADTQYLRVYVRQLRVKIGDDASDPRYIFTEPSVGYRFREI